MNGERKRKKRDWLCIFFRVSNEQYSLLFTGRRSLRKFKKKKKKEDEKKKKVDTYVDSLHRYVD